jgi:uncharacterized protein YeeX (DUF496 family)
MNNEDERSENCLESSIQDKNTQVSFLKERLNLFLDVLDAIDPEDTDIEDIDRLIEMIDDLEDKCREIKQREM